MTYSLEESQTTSTDIGYSGSGNYRYATTFKAVRSYTLAKVELLLLRQGDPSNLTVEIQTTTAGEPNGEVLATQSVNIDAITLDTAGEWVPIIFDTPAVLTINMTYAIVTADGHADVSNRYGWRYNKDTDTYADGQMYYATTGENWASYNYDMAFKNYSYVPEYVDLAGTGGGTGGGSATLELEEFVDLAGTGGGTGGGSADLFMSGMPVAAVGISYAYTRLVAVGNNEFWYEDI